MENDDELIQLFIEEAHELTQEINQHLEQWKTEPSQVEQVVPILRALHTLKGSARMFGFIALSEYVHRLEQVIQSVNEKEPAIVEKSLKEFIIYNDFLNDYIKQFSQTHTLPTHLISSDQLVSRLERVVRQVSRELGKEVRLKCIKAQEKIDSKILETLMPSLEHLVRNAIDHGIETPEVREKMGKPRYGIITLSFSKKGNEVVIQLSDDGQGIDIDKIKKKAVEKKRWDPHLPMTLSNAVEMISTFGFSTKEEATPISGRGIGLDIVNSAINTLGGTLLIESQINQGTQFTIRLKI